MLLRHMTQFWTMLKCWVTTAQVSRTSEAGDSGGTVGVKSCWGWETPSQCAWQGRAEDVNRTLSKTAFLLTKKKKIFLSSNFSLFYLISCFQEHPHLPSPSFLISCTHGRHVEEVSRDPFCLTLTGKVGSEAWLRDGDERRDITSIAQARADRVTQACVGRRTRRGVIWCLLLYHRTSGCTWSAFLTGWTPPTTVKGHCDTLPKMTEKLGSALLGSPDTWSWYEQELRAQGLEHVGIPGEASAIVRGPSLYVTCFMPLLPTHLTL